MYHDDPSADLDWPTSPDYAAEEAADREEEHAWISRLPWLTASERCLQRLASHPKFPGAYADEAAYDAFATELRLSSQRIVACHFRLNQGSVRVQGAFDLVSGKAFFNEGGHYRLADELPPLVDIELADVPRATLHMAPMQDGVAHIEGPRTSQPHERATLSEVLRARPGVGLSALTLNAAVEQLALHVKLPPIEASFNGTRFGTFFPI